VAQHEPAHDRLTHVLEHAVGHEQQSAADADGDVVVVELDVAAGPERSSEAALTVGPRHTVILGELLEAALGELVHPRVADVEHVRGAAFEHHGAERADVAAVSVVAIRATQRLRVEP
jgi:hypothetical protein